MSKVVIIGPAHPLRGGLASYDERLARQFMREGDDCIIYTFSLQYPGFLFPGTTQYSSEPAPTDLHIRVRINSVNPYNWMAVGRELRKLCPDIIVVRYWLPFMGPCLGTILRLARSNGHTQVICIADNVIPHEKRPGDNSFTRYFLGSVHACVTMSEKVLGDLRQMVPAKPARFVAHPLYDNFGEKIDKNEARAHLRLPVNDRIILFFGFIRRYKGLDLLLEAMRLLREKEAGDIRLLVAGEFYEDSTFYDRIIREAGIEEQLILRTAFIPDSEVKYYLCAADAVVQPYRQATQSGVTPLSYHFERPMVVTNVGGLPALVPHEKVGLVCDPNPESIAQTILHFYNLGEAFFLPAIVEEKKKYAWSNMTAALRDMAHRQSPAHISAK